MVNNNTLLITGAIDIRCFNIPLTALKNLEDRLEQYIYSIEYAIINYQSVNNIIFCENTNYSYDYSELCHKARMYDKNLEIISFLGDYESIQKFGKGYGEGEIIKYALENSKLLKNSHYFYKLTGRLIISNFDKVVKKSNEDNIFAYVPGATKIDNLDHVDTVFYKVSKDFYFQKLIDTYIYVSDKDKSYLEYLFYEKLKNENIKSFSIIPNIKGQSGSRGDRYELSKKLKFKEVIFSLLGVHNIRKTWLQKRYLKFILFILKTYRS